MKLEDSTEAKMFEESQKNKRDIKYGLTILGNPCIFKIIL